MNNAYAERVLKVARYLHDICTHKLPDRYAVLRHALFLSDMLLESIYPSESSMFLGREENLGALDTLTRVSLQEFAWSQALRNGQVLTADTVNSLTHGERTALVRGAVRSQTLLDAQLLVDQLGISATRLRQIDRAEVAPELPPPVDRADPALREEAPTPLTTRPLTHHAPSGMTSADGDALRVPLRVRRSTRDLAIPREPGPRPPR